MLKKGYAKLTQHTYALGDTPSQQRRALSNQEHLQYCEKLSETLRKEVLDDCDVHINNLRYAVMSCGESPQEEGLSPSPSLTSDKRAAGKRSAFGLSAQASGAQKSMLKIFGGTQKTALEEQKSKLRSPPEGLKVGFAGSGERTIGENMRRRIEPYREPFAAEERGEEIVNMSKGKGG